MRSRSMIGHVVFVSVLAAPVMLSACRDEPVVAPQAISQVTALRDTQLDVPSQAPTRGFLTTTVADLALNVTGSFRPGQPIRVTARVTGKHRSARSYVELRADGGGTVGALQRNRPRRWETPLATGQGLDLAEDVVFDKPGYYGLTAGVWVRDRDVPAASKVGDSILVSHAVERVWVLVDEKGGRLDRQYDVSMQEEGRVALTYGTVGAFEPADVTVGASAETNAPIVARAMVDPTMTGIVTYLPADSTFALPRVGIPGALVVGNCMIGGTPLSYFSVATDANGAFTATCPAGSTSYQGQVKLEASTHRIYIYSITPAIPANTNFNIAANAVDTVAVIDDAGKTFVNHSSWNLAATSLFGRSRSQMRYVVNPGTSGTSFYSTSSDYITLYAGAIWGGWGEFIVSHEYGHAFHYTAIDRWSSYDCSPGGAGHSFNSVETSSCAYVEGFADFFAAMMLRNRPLATQGLNVDDLEQSVYRFVGQGLFIEHTFAATLWDIVDDSFTADSYAGDDDGLSMTGTQVADIMLRCRLYNPGTYLLSHTDQFTYCAEGAVNNARTVAPVAYQSGWGTYGSPLSFDGGTPLLPYLPVFRAIWKYNFYGI